MTGRSGQGEGCTEHSKQFNDCLASIPPGIALLPSSFILDVLLSCSTDALGAVSQVSSVERVYIECHPLLSQRPPTTMAEEVDPQEFMQRIRQLGEQRDQQDAERVKKLEEDLIQGRSERLARRAGGCQEHVSFRRRLH